MIPPIKLAIIVFQKVFNGNNINTKYNTGVLHCHLNRYSKSFFITYYLLVFLKPLKQYLLEVLLIL